MVAQHIAGAGRIFAGENDAGLVGVLATGGGRIDRDDNAHRFGDGFEVRPAQLLEALAVRQRTRHILEDLGVVA